MCSRVVCPGRKEISKQQPTMNSTVFKYKHHYQQQNLHFNKRSSSSDHSNKNNNNNCHDSISRIDSHKNNNQNSIFILNTATNNILPNSSQFYYTDLNDNNVAPSSSSSATASSSVWSSASSTMCSPAAHAIQKLFNCSSNNLRLNNGNYRGIEATSFKSKSEILKKKSKFWKYLEGEANCKNTQRAVNDTRENEKKILAKSLKYEFKSKYWPKSYESDHQTQQDLSELLEYSCSLCDNCRCMDCQIGYFDCENSDDSNSEYSFHLNAYEEDEEEFADNRDDENTPEHAMELKTSSNKYNSSQTLLENCCSTIDQRQHHIRELKIDSRLTPNCSIALCACNRPNCAKAECCRQCFIESVEGDGGGQEEVDHQHNFTAMPDH